VSGQFHALVTLLKGNYLPLTIGYDTGCTLKRVPDAVVKKNLSLLGIEP